MSVWGALAGSRAAEGLAARVAGGGIAHAWLFVGPSGAGKREASFALAAALNCRIAPGTGCGRCAACERVLRGRHPDVHHVVPEGPIISVDVIRETVVPEVARSPFEGPFKVFVIEEADRMNDAAQNALLKTLEEPPDDTVMVLITTVPDDLLDTIRSRCRLLRFDPVAADAVAGALVARGADPERARLAARVSDGDRVRAAAIAFDDDARNRRSLWLRIPSRLAGLPDALDAGGEVLALAKEAVAAHEKVQRSEVAGLAEAMGEGRGTAAARNALSKRHRRELRRLEEDVIAEALTVIASFYRDVVAARAGSGGAILNTDVTADIDRWARSEVSDGALLSAAERLGRARTSLSLNANAALAVDAALVELAGLVPPPPEALVAGEK